MGDNTVPQGEMATDNQKHLASENEEYATHFTTGDLPLPPAKNYLIGEP